MNSFGVCALILSVMVMSAGKWTKEGAPKRHKVKYILKKNLTYDEELFAKFHFK